ncbi:hypothetical protein HNR16_003520 [Pseudoclavibacter chungangensis]|uniref:hypothetical protein n=1 Tax=Pseudoclavibacter chungangensis TaxID=587635 RepID=UPI0017881866|nr:hypothetical protein [Pseudoclavibacter chungangensis]NYJ68732.1 hypothetical protein [Pseudoclavibacter chungangensis]
MGSSCARLPFVVTAFVGDVGSDLGVRLALGARLVARHPSGGFAAVVGHVPVRNLPSDAIASTIDCAVVVASTSISPILR